MLDKKSEIFLKYIINTKSESLTDIPLKTKDIGLSYENINDICKTLESEGYIDCLPGEDGVHTVLLRHKGSVYFSHKFKTNLRFWLPFIISVATLVLTLLTYIKE